MADVPKVMRLNRSEPPPGWNIVPVPGRFAPCWRWQYGGDHGEDCEKREQAIHLAWNRHEERQDPPGMWSRGGARGDFASLGQFGVDAANVSLVSNNCWTHKDARRAAWARYWRVTALLQRAQTIAARRRGTTPAGPKAWADDWYLMLGWPEERLANEERELDTLEKS